MSVPRAQHACSTSPKPVTSGNMPGPNTRSTFLITPRRAFADLVVCVLLVVGFSSHAQAVELTDAQLGNRACYDCHGQRRITDLSARERRSMLIPPDDPLAFERMTEPRPGLYTAPDTLSDGPHAALACTDCHGDTVELPHAMTLEPANCTDGCHAPAAAEHRRGIHAEASSKGDTRAPSCADCHGGHDVYPSTDKRSSTYPLNVINLCGDCHSQHNEQTSNGHDETLYVRSYMQSVHGKAINEGGLIVAATCVDCHGGHAVRPSSDTASPINRENVPETCGQCHRGIEDVYAKSIHGQKLAGGDPDAPVCTDCHAAHAISQSATPGFMRDIVGECGQCHDRVANSESGRASLYDTYRMSYHGQVNALGSSRAARCSDCHGAHDILPVADPDSRLHSDNRLQTCARCHKNATAGFAQFMPHADYRDGVNFPILHGVWLYFVVLMSITFGFYGIHSVLWLVRSLIERRRRTTQEAPARHVAQGKAVKRFRKINRVNHALVVVSFFGLTLTGMPLFFSDQAWAKRLAEMLGGGYAAGMWHRFFAMILVVNFVIHVVGVHKRFRKQPARMLLTGPYTLLPRMKDVYDCLGMFRWFFTGKGKPAFDRWTYWEKFDYWAEIVGTFIIGGTGLMLWFPGVFSKFIPGWGFNIATIVHGYEALLAVGFIFTIHFFNANLRPEKFPVDDVIFTGVVSEEELREERPMEYERLKESGELQSLLVPEPPRWQRKAAVVVGVTAMTIGTSMVVLIILAGLGLI
jgi:cytochrome b subunit of formate dehydrogenase